MITILPREKIPFEGKKKTGQGSVRSRGAGRISDSVLKLLALGPAPLAGITLAALPLHPLALRPRPLRPLQQRRALRQRRRPSLPLRQQRRKSSFSVTV